MATEIKYTDLYGNITTPQQIEQMDIFVKKTYVDGVLKIEERNSTVKNKKYRRFYYFLDDATEDKNTIAKQFYNVEENAICFIRHNRQTANGFTLWDTQVYDTNGSTTGEVRFQEVFDSRGRIIYSSSFYEQTKQLRSVTKVMYANEVENAWEDTLFDFRFSFDFDTGKRDLNILDTNDRYYWLMPKDINVEFVKEEGYWDNRPYFHSHLPILPETPII